MSWFSRRSRKSESSPPARPDPPPPTSPAPAELPAASTARFLELAQGARADVRERIVEVNQMTEREVLGAARNISSIVEQATMTTTKLRNLATRFDAAGDDGIATSISAQTEMVRQFVVELVELSRTQAEASLGAQRVMQELGKASQAIDRLASEAKILALNSRLEAGRAGTDGRAFSVVSDEMRRLAAAVATTNTGVRDLSSSVGTALAQVAKNSQNMRERVQRFADASVVGSTKLRSQVDTYRQETTSALADTDQQIAKTLTFSNAALSNLQFQDVVAQGLLRLDGRMRDLQVALATACGVPEEQATIEPPTHSEVGGDKDVAHEAAGEMLLF